jgi:poly-gamma-glutamate system protein
MGSSSANFLRFPLAIAALVCAAAGWLPAAGRTSGPSVDSQAIEAARLMERSLVSIKALRLEKRLPIDPALDPNGTGIVGDEFSPLTTSVGDVEAKRTAANPAFAAVMVGYFRRAGLREGDVVAVGASGSFPAFALATLSAARALGLRPVVVYSVGASMYGANLPGFTLVDMLSRLRGDLVLPYHLAAVSPGGSADTGGGVLFDESGETLRAETRRSGLPLVRGATLAARIRDRLRIYDEGGAGRPVRCFVNIGGSAASFGSTNASLSLPNGLVFQPPIVPASPTRGVAFEYAARGVPVVHLLFVKGLARDNGLPWDPVPFPKVGEGKTYQCEGLQ